VCECPILPCRALHAGMKKRGEAGCVGGPIVLGLVLEAVTTIGEFEEAQMVIRTRSKITRSDM